MLGQTFQKSYEFLSHLKEQELYAEGIRFIEKNTWQFQSDEQSDSIFYFKGLFQYRLKQPENSITSFSNIKRLTTEVGYHSMFLRGFQHSFIGNHDDAKKVLGSISSVDPFYKEIQAHELAGVSLLERDFDSYNKYATSFSGKYFQLTRFQEQLEKNKNGLLNAKKKSPFLAGLMSGIVPGSGKFYVGKVGEGYTTLLLSTIMALQLRESYRKDGANSTRFKVFAALFSTLYIANIWGSVLSVKIYKDDFDQTFDEAILLNMHVPLRTIFD